MEATVRKTLSRMLAAMTVLVASVIGGGGVALADSGASAAVPDTVQRGGVVVYKYDAETKKSAPQGGADLAGAEFTITNEAKNPVVVLDEYGHKRTYAVGESWTIKTKWDASKNAYVAETPAKSLPYGTYHIQETKAPSGYGLPNARTYLNHKYVPGYIDQSYAAWANAGYDFTISSDGQIVTFNGTPTGKAGETPGCYDPLVRGGIEVIKRDHDLLAPTAQGDGSLQDGEFEVYNWSDHDIVLWDHFDQSKPGVEHGVVAGASDKTDANGSGVVRPGGKVATITTGTDGRAQTFMDALPAGWYKVVEKKAPHGYANSEQWTSYVEITDDDWDTVVATDCDDPIIRGGVSFQKVDHDFMKESDPQGDGTLEGATIKVVNKSATRVFIKQQANDASHVSGWVDPDGTVATIKTDASGYAQLLELPYGSYEAVETDPSTGYRVNDGWKWDFQIHSGDAVGDAVVTKATKDDGWLVEDVIRNNETTEHDPNTASDRHGNVVHSIDGHKLDAESRANAPKGAATLKDATIQIRNVSDHDVFWYGKRYKVGAVMGTTQTDDDGYWYFNTLPYGSYELSETGAPEGYLVNSTWKPIVRIRQQDVCVHVDDAPATLSQSADSTKPVAGESTTALADPVSRDDIKIQKLDHDTQKQMANVAFKVTSKTTGEWHILVTDANGIIDTSAQTSANNGSDVTWRKHSDNTNANDALYDAASNSITDSSKLTGASGVWFYGTAKPAKDDRPLDWRSALPYDEYEIEEVRCDANRGKSLIKRDVTLKYQNNTLVDLGTLNNDVPDPDKGLSCVVGNTIDVEKSVDSIQHKQGDTVTYTLAYTNTGATTANVQLRDYVPSGMSFVSADRGGAKATDGNGDYVEWVIDGVRPGASGTVTFRTRLDDASQPVIANRAHMGVVADGTKAGDPKNADPAGRSNIVHVSTDGTKVGPDIYATKSSSVKAGEKLHIGDEVTYTMTVTNKGDSAKTGVSVRDTLPYGLEVATHKDSDGYDVPSVSDDGSISGSTVTWVLTGIQPGETRKVSVTAKVTDKVGDTVSDQAFWGTTCGNQSGSFENSTNVVEDEVEKAPSVTVSKSSDAGSDGKVAYGQVVTFTLHVANSGHGNAEGLDVYDAIPSDMQYVAGSMSQAGGVTVTEPSDNAPYAHWTIAKLAHDGGSIDLSFKARVKDKAASGIFAEQSCTSGAKAGDRIENVAQAGGEFKRYSDGVLGAGRSATDPTDSVAKATYSNKVDLTVADPSDDVATTKSADPASGSSVKAGDTITYTIDWRNDGDKTVYNYEVIDAIPKGTTFVPGSIKVTGADGRQSQATSDDSDHSVDTGVCEPEHVTWTQIATLNASDPTAIYDAVVRDASKQHLSQSDFDAVRAYLGSSERKAGDYIDFEVPEDGWYTALWRATYMGDGHISLLMRLVVPGTNGSRNAATSGNAFANYDPSRDSVYAIVRELAPGETGSLTFQVKVDDDVAANTHIQNKASYGVGNGLVVDASELGHETDSTDHVVGEPHLTATKTSDHDGQGVRTGDVISYAVTVTNDGTADADDVSLYDRFGGVGDYVTGSYQVTGGAMGTTQDALASAINADSTEAKATLDRLAPGESATMAFKVRVSAHQKGDKLDNIARYGFGEASDKLPDETNKVTSTVVDAMDGVHIEQVANPADGSVVDAGSTITYVATITNDSGVDAKGLAVYDKVPDGMTLVSAGSGLKAAGDRSYVSSDPFDLANGATRTFTMVARVADDAKADTTVTNVWSLGENQQKAPSKALQLDSNQVVHSVSDAASQLVATMTQDPADGTAVTGTDQVTYTITVKNPTKVTIPGVAVRSAFPDGATYVDGSATEGAETGDGHASWLIGDLKAGESKSVSFKAQVNVGKVGEVTADATFDANQKAMPTSDLSRRTNDVDVISYNPQMAITLVQDPADGSTVAPGDTIHYTATVENVGKVTARDVSIYDVAPAQTAYVDGSLKGSDGTRANVGDDGLLTVQKASVEAGERFTLDYDVKVDLTASGSITNKALWVAPASTDLGSVHIIADAKDATGATGAVAASDVARILAKLGPTKAYAFDVTKPDGASSGESEETGRSGDSNETGATVSPADPARDDAGTTKPAPGTGDAKSGDVKVDGNDNPTDANVDRRNEDGSESDPTHAHVTPAQVTLSKTVDHDASEQLMQGTVVTYTVKADNTGSGNANSIVIEDTLPDGLELVTGSAKAEGLDVAEDGNTVRATGSIAKGASATITYKATVTGKVEGVITNTASWQQTDQGKVDKPQGSAQAQVTTKTEKPAFSATKTSDADGKVVKTGDTVTYTISTTNVGKVASDIAITDQLPDGLEFVGGTDCVLRGRTVTADAKDVAPGQTKTVSYQAKVTLDEGTIRNYATVDAGDSSTTASDEVTVGKPHVSVTKSSDVAAGTKVSAGDVITYTIHVANSGTAAGHVTISDQLPEGLELVGATDLSWEGDVAAGDSYDLTYQAKVTASGPATLENDVSATCDGDAIDGASATVEVGVPALSVTKSQSVDEGATLSDGDPVDYVIRVANVGDATAHGVTVTDQLPEGVASDDVMPEAFDLAAGESRDVTIHATAKASEEGELTVANKAKAAASDAPEVESNEVTLKVAQLDPPHAEAEVEKVADKAVVDNGGQVTYTVTVTNSGNAAGRFSVLDQMPEGMTLVGDSGHFELTEPDADTGNFQISDADQAVMWAGTLQAGHKAVITYRADVADDASGTLTNGAIATVDGSDSKTASADVRVGEPKLEVSKAQSVEDGATLADGDAIDYDITVTNSGDGTARNVSVTDDVPEGLESDGIQDGTFDLAPGESRTVTLHATAKADADHDVVVSNTAKAKADNADEATSNTVTATVARHVPDAPDIRVSKASDVADGAIVKAGSTIAYTIDVRNFGSAAGYADVTDTLPEGLSLVKGGWRFEVTDPATDTGEFRITEDGVLGWGGTVQAGHEARITYQVTVDDGAEGKLTNKVALKVDGQDQPGAESTVDAGEPKLEATKEQSVDKGATLKDGDPVTYTITVTNTGDNVAHDVRVHDALPAGLTADSNDDHVFDLAAGESHKVTISAKAQGSDDAEQTVTNIAHVTAANADAVDTNPVTLKVAQNKPEIVVTKQSDHEGKVAKSGEEIRYTVTMENVGTKGGDVTLTDQLPEGIGLVADSEHAKASDRKAAYGDFELADANAIRWEGTIGRGAKVVVSYKATMGDGTTGKVTNTAHVVTDGTDETDASATVDAGYPALGATKSQSVAEGTTVHDGDEVAYTIHVANDGPATAKGITVTDELPHGLAAEGATDVPAFDLASGESKDITIKARAVGSTESETKVSNTAHVTSANAGEADTNAVTLVVARREAGVHVTKSSDFDGKVARPGDTITYTLVATNDGEASGAVTISDTLPEGLDLVSSSASDDRSGVIGRLVSAVTGNGTGTTEDGNTVSWSGTLDPGAKVTITYKAKVADGTSGDVTNTAKVTVDGTDADGASDTVSVRSGAKLEATKSQSVDEGATVQNGDAVDYTIHVSNIGDEVAKDVHVEDALPEGLEATGVDLSAIKFDLAPGQSSDIVLHARAKAADDHDITVTNVATVKADGLDDVRTNEVSLTVARRVPATPDIKVTKAVDADGLVARGTKLTYTVTATNSGDAAGAATISDELPEGLGAIENAHVTGSATDSDLTVESRKVILSHEIAPGETVTLTYQATVDADAPAGDLTNTAALTVDGEDKAGGSATVTVGVPKLEASITQSADEADDGDEVAYTIHVANTGNADAHGVTVESVLPAGLTSDDAMPEAFDLAAGESRDITVKAVAHGADGSETTAARGATIKATDADGVEAEPVTLTIHGLYPEIVASKSQSAPEADDGDAITYTIHVENVGRGTARNVRVSDRLAEGLTSDDAEPEPFDLAAGESRDIHVHAFTHALDGEDRSIDNAATISADGLDDVTTNTVTLKVKGLYPELKVTKSQSVAQGATIQSGDAVTYAIHVANVGRGTARNVKVADELPEGVESSSAMPEPFDLAAGESRDVTVDATATGSEKGNTEVANVAKASADNADEVASNEVDLTVAKVIPARPHAAIKKTVDKTSLRPGDTAGYTVVVTNTGDAAGDFAIEDTLPDGLELDAGSVKGADASGNTVSSRQVIDAGQSATITYSAKVVAKAAGDITNTATAKVYLIKDVNPSAAKPNPVAHVLSLLGIGDAAPAGQPADASSEDAAASSSDGTTDEAAPADDASSEDASASPSDGASDEPYKTADSSATVGDDGEEKPYEVVDSSATVTPESEAKDTATVTVTGNGPALKVTKTPSVTSYQKAGDKIAWTIAITNAGDTDAKGVKLADTPQAGLKIVGWHKAEESVATDDHDTDAKADDASKADAASDASKADDAAGKAKDGGPASATVTVISDDDAAKDADAKADDASDEAKADDASDEAKSEDSTDGIADDGTLTIDGIDVAAGQTVTYVVDTEIASDDVCKAGATLTNTATASIDGQDATDSATIGYGAPEAPAQPAEQQPSEPAATNPVQQVGQALYHTGGGLAAIGLVAAGAISAGLGLASKRRRK